MDIVILFCQPMDAALTTTPCVFHCILLCCIADLSYFSQPKHTAELFRHVLLQDFNGVFERYVKGQYHSKP